MSASVISRFSVVWDNYFKFPTKPYICYNRRQNAELRQLGMTVYVYVDRKAIAHGKRSIDW